MLLSTKSETSSGARSLLESPGRSLARLFLDAAATNGPNPALDVDGVSYSYEALRVASGRIAGALQSVERSEPRLGAVFASRSQVAFAGILGTLISGAGYVPLNPKFPDARTLYMLESSGAMTLVSERAMLDRLPALLNGVSRSLVVVLPDVEDVNALAAAHPSHRFVGSAELAACDLVQDAPAVDEDGIAYLMFTSGSTGAPKGVMVTHANVLHHAGVMWERYGIGPSDRMSQAFDLTFDLSVFDMFVAWGRGASLHVVPAKEQMAPAKFIAQHALTTWFSVPSVGKMLQRLRVLKPGAFPSLRWSLFCGERLPADVADAWSHAAPNSIVENLYGPTEVTIACTLYRWDAESSPGACVDGGVPIGRPYDGMSAAIVDQEGGLVTRGERGELCMRGPQVAPGYWRDPSKTAERFVWMSWDDGPSNRWYRTGDTAFIDVRGDLIHCGRNDDQIKLRGFRVELAEIEHVVRTSAEADAVVVIPWPDGPEGPTGVVAFVVGAKRSDEALLGAAKAHLPDYMIPHAVVRLDELPLNDNGKIDRKNLRSLLERRDAEPR